MKNSMESFKKIITGLPIVIYYIIESLVLWCIPKRFRCKDITGEIILITGAGSGIGREISLELAKHGVTLIFLDINVKGMEETRDLVKKSQETVNVFIYECDISDRKAVYEVAAKIKDEIGVVTILVNNAGFVTGKRFLDCPDDMIQKTMDVNIMAHFWTCKALLPDMIAANHGHIVFISSAIVYLAAPRLTDYCASKHAVVGFEEALRMELESEGYTGVKTTLVALSFVTTGLFNGFRVPSFISPLTAEKVAKEVVAGILVDQEVIVIPGRIFLFIILKTIFPTKAIRKIAEITNLTNSMDSFQGRTKTNEPLRQ